MACWALFVLAFATFSQVSGAIIGKNSITCITFGPPYSWDKKLIASNGVFLNNYGVELTPTQGSSGYGVKGTEGGEFKSESKLEVPYLAGNDFSEFSMSLWFKRKAPAAGAAPIVGSNDCANPSIEINSVSPTSVNVKIRSTLTSHNVNFATNSQTANFVNIVVTTWMDNVSTWGWAYIYADGKLKKTLLMKGRLPGTFFPMAIGGSPQCAGGGAFFEGVMDTISFARYRLSPKEVKALFNNPESCIGE